MRCFCYSSDLIRLVAGLSAVLLFVGYSCRVVVAQQAQADPTAEIEKPAGVTAAKPYRRLAVDQQQKKARLQITRILLAGKFAAGQQALFDKYYRSYALARWSLPENRAALPVFRKDLRNNLRSCGTGGRPAAVHDHLSALALKYLSGLARGNFHPAVRVNAVLMIGELNVVEASRPSDLPTVLPEALPVLLRTVADPQQLDAVKVAALVGIAHHARLGGITSAEDRAAVTRAMLALAGAKGAAGRSAAGHAWMRAQAVEVLGKLKSVGAAGEVPGALAGIVAEKGLPFSTRCAAAEALGQLNYRASSGLNASQLAAALGQLAEEVCAAEAEAETISRRRLKTRLSAASVGLTGIATLATGPPRQAFVGALEKPLSTMLDIIADKRLDDQQMMERVNQEAAKLRTALTKRPK